MKFAPGRQLDLLREEVDLQLPDVYFRFGHGQVGGLAPDVGSVVGPLGDEGELGGGVVVPGHVHRVELLVPDEPLEGGEGVTGYGGAGESFQVSGG